MIASMPLTRLDLSHPRHTPLEGKEEFALTQIIRGGGPAARRARDKLVNANMKFVVSVARNYIGSGLPMEDLINEGAIGLVRAAQKFEPAENVRFISYAVWWIRQAIVFALQQQVTTIRTPARHLLQSEMRQGKEKLRRALKAGNPERVEKVQAGIESTQVKMDAIQRIRAAVSLFACMEDGWEPRDEFADTAAGLEAREDQRAVERLMASLKPIEQAMLRRYYGLDNGDPETLEEVGARFNLTRERVRQIKAKALIRMKRAESKN